MLRAELAFYVGCLDLHDRLRAKGEPCCLPEAEPPEPRRLATRGLYDPCLILRREGRVVGNDATADGKDLLVVTGANTGGKSTFLRSPGLAQLMMQAGTIVAAEAFRCSLCDSLATHYIREEDAGQRSGKLDEELARMSAIVDHLTPRALVLFNESFAATNEREGSEIARQVVTGLLDGGIRRAFVTHLHEFPRRLWDSERDRALFLRAERTADGRRSFRVMPGEPLPTSHAEGLWRRVFGPAGAGVGDWPTPRA